MLIHPGSGQHIAGAVPAATDTLCVAVRGSAGHDDGSDVLQVDQSVIEGGLVGLILHARLPPERSDIDDLVLLDDLV